MKITNGVFNMRGAAYFVVCLKKLLLRLVVALFFRDKGERKFHLKKWTGQVEKKYLERYLYVLDTQKQQLNTCPKTIWVCWLQGFENAPAIIRACLKSLQKHCPDFEIIQITAENIKMYVDIPDYIYKKFEQGKISRTQFSDLLRLALLSQHGGYWIDATVFLAKPIENKILQAEFFAYHCKGTYKNNSWFLKAAADDMIIRNMKNLMFEYWKYENRLLNYFLYHLFFDLMMEKNKILAAQWDKVPLLYDDCYELYSNFFMPYDKEKWRKINEKTTIHKLNHRYLKDNPIENTFLEALLADKLDMA